jgi:hypothetical protein
MFKASQYASVRAIEKGAIQIFTVQVVCRAQTPSFRKDPVALLAMQPVRM